MGLKKILKEYYGLVPVLGGTVIAGAVGVVAYTIGSAQELTNQIEYIITTQDIWGGLSALCDSGSALAGRYIIPGFIAGQILTYKLKKAIFSFLK